MTAHTNKYEATDREMSSWVVFADHNGTRFYLTDETMASDMLTRAARFRYFDLAKSAADAEQMPGFAWAPMSVPQAINERNAR